MSWTFYEGTRLFIILMMIMPIMIGITIIYLRSVQAGVVRSDEYEKYVEEEAAKNREEARRIARVNKMR